MHLDEPILWLIDRFDRLRMLLDSYSFYIGGFRITLFNVFIIAFFLNLIVAVLWKGAKG